MEETKRLLHLYSTDDEWKEINEGLDRERLTESGKIRSGDLVRMILLNFVRDKK